MYNPEGCPSGLRSRFRKPVGKKASRVRIPPFPPQGNEMSNDIVRAKGYAIYKDILNKALNFLMNAVLKCVITEYKNWDAAVVLNMRVMDGKITRRTAKITIKDRPVVEKLAEEWDADTTVIDRSDLNHIMNSGQFDIVIHSIKELDEK
jgi:hypothetical protein